MAKWSGEQVEKALDDIHGRLAELSKLEPVTEESNPRIEEKLRDIGDLVIAMFGEGTGDNANRPE